MYVLLFSHLSTSTPSSFMASPPEVPKTFYYFFFLIICPFIMPFLDSVTFHLQLSPFYLLVAYSIYLVFCPHLTTTLIRWHPATIFLYITL